MNRTQQQLQEVPSLSKMVFLNPACQETTRSVHIADAAKGACGKLDRGGDDAEEDDVLPVTSLERTMSSDLNIDDAATTTVSADVKTEAAIDGDSEYDCDERMLVARRDVPKGSVVLIEHSLTVPVELMRNALRHDEGAFNMLCPRHTSKRWGDYDKNSSSEFDDLIDRKISQN